MATLSSLTRLSNQAALNNLTQAGIVVPCTPCSTGRASYVNQGGYKLSSTRTEASFPQNTK